MMIPWFVSSFICLLDFGYCAYGMIATQNAARAAAQWGAASATNYAALSSTTACNAALPFFKNAPTPVTACGTSLSATTSEPSVNGLSAVTVAVTYTVNLLSLPPLMPGTFAITRTVTMPIRY